MANGRRALTSMSPEAFIRLSIGSLGLRFTGVELKTQKSENEVPLSYVCEIRLRGFPVQRRPVPLISSSSGITSNILNNASSFYLEESDFGALSAPGCFNSRPASLEITVFTEGKEFSCGAGIKRQQIGIFKMYVGRDWGERKPMILFNGWTSIGKNKEESGKLGPELHLRVTVDADPRYVFQFEDIPKSSPQIVHQQGSFKQPIFSCKFRKDREAQIDPVSLCCPGSISSSCLETERRERKGWKVIIHDLCGSAIAAAFISTPFVPSTGCDWVARTSPGAWLIVRPDAFRPESWLPWGKLEAWRECGSKNSVCFRFHLLSGDREGGEVFMSEAIVNAEKGGEFIIDTEKKTQTATAAASPLPRSQSCVDSGARSPAVGGFVMSCRVDGEGKRGRPSIQIAKRHVTCLGDAAIFMALAAAVDLSVKACRPFRRKIRIKKNKGNAKMLL